MSKANGDPVFFLALACKLTTRGIGYNGSVNVAASGETCDYWSKLGGKTPPMSWRFGTGRNSFIQTHQRVENKCLKKYIQ